MKDIRNYEGIYAVTEDGRVFSYKTNKFLKPHLINSGYFQIRLRKDNKTDSFLVHRLVAETFIANPNCYTEVNHKDECKTNNSVDNLEWCTHDYNMSYGNRRTKTLRKVYCLELDRVFESIVAASNELNIHAGNITQCCQGTRYKTAGGYHWQYI